jgi:7,8-dihydro-6-hydroxymethylpterin-pyrophosphokinase (HPPK)
MGKVTVISVGSNSSDREWQVEQAIEYLLSTLTDGCASSVYETKALNGKDAPYYNCVVLGKTDLSLEELTGQLKEYETKAGRDDMSRIEGIVPIDLDIVIWDGRIIRNDDFEKTYFNQGYRELLTQGAFER